MKSFEDQTYLGRVRTFRTMAGTALRAYGLERAPLTFLTYHGNVIYRVDAPEKSPVGRHDRIYAPDRYVLRIHMDYHTTAAIRSELQWLRALRRDEDMPVPEPVSTVDGDLLTEVDIPGTSKTRKCSLLRWMNGQFLRKRLRPRHCWNTRKD